jgi:hypothetical protein
MQDTKNSHTLPKDDSHIIEIDYDSERDGLIPAGADSDIIVCDFGDNTLITDVTAAQSDTEVASNPPITAQSSIPNATSSAAQAAEPVNPFNMGPMGPMAHLLSASRLSAWQNWSAGKSIVEPSNEEALDQFNNAFNVGQNVEQILCDLLNAAPGLSSADFQHILSPSKVAKPDTSSPLNPMAYDTVSVHDTVFEAMEPPKQNNTLESKISELPEQNNVLVSKSKELPKQRIKPISEYSSAEYEALCWKEKGQEEQALFLKFLDEAKKLFESLRDVLQGGNTFLFKQQSMEAKVVLFMTNANRIKKEILALYKDADFFLVDSCRMVLFSLLDLMKIGLRVLDLEEDLKVNKVNLCNYPYINVACNLIDFAKKLEKEVSALFFGKILPAERGKYKVFVDSSTQVSNKAQQFLDILKFWKKIQFDIDHRQRIHTEIISQSIGSVLNVVETLKDLDAGLDDSKALKIFVDSDPVEIIYEFAQSFTYIKQEIAKFEQKTVNELLEHLPKILDKNYFWHMFKGSGFYKLIREEKASRDQIIAEQETLVSGFFRRSADSADPKFYENTLNHLARALKSIILLCQFKLEPFLSVANLSPAEKSKLEKMPEFKLYKELSPLLVYTDWLYQMAVFKQVDRINNFLSIFSESKKYKITNKKTKDQTKRKENKNKKISVKKNNEPAVSVKEEELKKENTVAVKSEIEKKDEEIQKAENLVLEANFQIFSSKPVLESSGSSKRNMIKERINKLKTAKNIYRRYLISDVNTLSLQEKLEQLRFRISLASIKSFIYNLNDFNHSLHDVLRREGMVDENKKTSYTDTILFYYHPAIDLLDHLIALQLVQPEKFNSADDELLSTLKSNFESEFNLFLDKKKPDVADKKVTETSPEKLTAKAASANAKTDKTEASVAPTAAAVQSLPLISQQSLHNAQAKPKSKYGQYKPKQNNTKTATNSAATASASALPNDATALNTGSKNNLNLDLDDYVSAYIPVLLKYFFKNMVVLRDIEKIYLSGRFIRELYLSYYAATDKVELKEMIFEAYTNLSLNEVWVRAEKIAKVHMEALIDKHNRNCLEINFIGTDIKLRFFGGIDFSNMAAAGVFNINHICFNGKNIFLLDEASGQSLQAGIIKFACNPVRFNLSDAFEAIMIYARSCHKNLSFDSAVLENMKNISVEENALLAMLGNLDLFTHLFMQGHASQHYIAIKKYCPQLLQGIIFISNESENYLKKLDEAVNYRKLSIEQVIAGFVYLRVLKRVENSDSQRNNPLLESLIPKIFDELQPFFNNIFLLPDLREISVTTCMEFVKMLFEPETNKNNILVAELRKHLSISSPTSHANPSIVMEKLSDKSTDKKITLHPATLNLVRFRENRNAHGDIDIASFNRLVIELIQAEPKRKICSVSDASAYFPVISEFIQNFSQPALNMFGDFLGGLLNANFVEKFMHDFNIKLLNSLLRIVVSLDEKGVFNEGQRLPIANNKNHSIEFNDLVCSSLEFLTKRLDNLFFSEKKRCALYLFKLIKSDLFYFKSLDARKKNQFVTKLILLIDNLESGSHFLTIDFDEKIAFAESLSKIDQETSGSYRSRIFPFFQNIIIAMLRDKYDNLSLNLDLLKYIIRLKLEKSILNNFSFSIYLKEIVFHIKSIVQGLSKKFDLSFYSEFVGAQLSLIDNNFIKYSDLLFGGHEFLDMFNKAINNKDLSDKDAMNVFLYNIKLFNENIFSEEVKPEVFEKLEEMYKRLCAKEGFIDNLGLKRAGKILSKKSLASAAIVLKPSAILQTTSPSLPEVSSQQGSHSKSTYPAAEEEGPYRVLTRFFSQTSNQDFKAFKNILSQCLTSGKFTSAFSTENDDLNSNLLQYFFMYFVKGTIKRSGRSNNDTVNLKSVENFVVWLCQPAIYQKLKGARHISTVIHRLGKLACHRFLTVDLNILSSALKELLPRLAEAKPAGQNIAKTISGLGKLARYGFLKGIDKIEFVKILNELLAVLIKAQPNPNAQDIPEIIGGLSRLIEAGLLVSMDKIFVTQVLNTLLAALEKSEPTALNISSTIFSLGKLAEYDLLAGINKNELGEILNRLLIAFVKANPNDQSIANTIFGLSFLHFKRDMVGVDMVAFVWGQRKRLESMFKIATIESKHQLHFGLSYVQNLLINKQDETYSAIAKLLADLTQEIPKPGSSDAHKDYLSQLKLVFGTDYIIESEKLIHGYFPDITIEMHNDPSFKVIIEIDGLKSHYVKGVLKPHNVFRQAYLESLGWKIERYVHTSSNDALTYIKSLKQKYSVPIGTKFTNTATNASLVAESLTRVFAKDQDLALLETRTENRSDHQLDNLVPIKPH